MTNEQLQKILARFPQTCEVEVQIGSTPPQAIDHAEYATPQVPQTVNDTSVAWADLVRDSIRVRLVTTPVLEKRVLPSEDAIDPRTRP